MKNLEAIKLCEIIIPTPYILNDNSQCSYKQNMGKYKWLEKQIHSSFYNGFDIDPWCCCWTKPIDECDFINKSHITLILTHYKASTAQKFDLANYERCFKPLIDGLSGKGYFMDDNYKVMPVVIFTGGSKNEWENGIFGINSHESKNYTVEEYILKMGAQRRMETTKYKKISNYDLFQIFYLNI